jgi:uncharacterized phiE125 gp8 family phage protein
MEMRYKLKTAPTLYPASLADLKRNLRIPTTDTDTDRDALLQDLLYEAIIASQNATGRQYCPATYTLYLDAYPLNDEIEISLGPVDSITSVKYYAPGDTELTELDEDNYQLDNSELTARLRFLESFEVDQERMNVIEIEFINGFAAPIGNQAPAVPVDLKQAIILRATEAYLRPENAIQNFGFSVATKAAEQKERNYRVQRY